VGIGSHGIYFAPKFIYLLEGYAFGAIVILLVKAGEYLYLND
jgi:hypothetical protein